MCGAVAVVKCQSKLSAEIRRRESCRQVVLRNDSTDRAFQFQASARLNAAGDTGRDGSWRNVTWICGGRSAAMATIVSPQNDRV